MAGVISGVARRTWSGALTILMGLGLVVGLVVAPRTEAHADTAAAELVRQWSHQLADQPGKRLDVVITGTQRGRSLGAAYATGSLTRNADGSLQMSGVRIRFSDRGGFDPNRADVSDFTLTREGWLVERSRTWGFVETNPLQHVGHGMLAAWAPPIGNGAGEPPSYWVIGARSHLT